MDDNRANPTIVGACPICFEPLTVSSEAFVETCLHHFCFNCITKWASLQENIGIVQCPVCKCEYKSIIYDCDGDSYRRWTVPAYGSTQAGVKNGWEVCTMMMTAAHRRRRCLYLTEVPNDVSHVKGSKPIKSVLTVFRPSVYEWLQRELQALFLHNDVDLLVQHVMGSLERKLLGARYNTDQSLSQTVDSVVFNLVMEAVESVLVQLNRRHGTEWARTLAAEFVYFVACGLTVAAYDEALIIQETALID